LGIAKQKYVDYSNFMREQCDLALTRNDEKLVTWSKGSGNILIQIDESVLSAPKLTRNQQARPVPEKWLFGAFDTQRKVGFIQSVPD
jgi:hypothetical protein